MLINNFHIFLCQISYFWVNTDDGLVPEAFCYEMLFKLVVIVFPFNKMFVMFRLVRYLRMNPQSLK